MKRLFPTVVDRLHSLRETASEDVCQDIASILALFQVESGRDREVSLISSVQSTDYCSSLHVIDLEDHS